MFRKFDNRGDVVILKDNVFYRVFWDDGRCRFRHFEPVLENERLECYVLHPHYASFTELIVILAKNDDGSKSIIYEDTSFSEHYLMLLSDCVVITPFVRKGEKQILLFGESLVIDYQGEVLEAELPKYHLHYYQCKNKYSHLEVRTMGFEFYYFMRKGNRFVQVEEQDLPEDNVQPYGVLTLEQLNLSDEERTILFG